MKKFLLAALGTMAFSTLASATIVTFNTGSAPLTCGSASNCVQNGGGTSLSFTNNSVVLTLSYTANNEPGINAQGGAGTNWGFLTPTISGFAGSSATFDLTGAHIQELLTITNPTGNPANTPIFGIGDFSGSLTVDNAGNLGGISRFLFNNPLSMVLGGSTPPVTVTLEQTAGGTIISTSNNTSIQGTITANTPVVNTTPEPSSFLLTGAALLGFGAMKLRKRA